MRVLIAEDDQVSRKVLEVSLTKWGHELTVVNNGRDALQALQSDNAPNLALLDWMMPEMEGLEVVQNVRSAGYKPLPYLILLTARADKESLVRGLEAGADDYITKPFDRDELRARLQVGCRMVELHSQLMNHAMQLEESLAQVRLLQGLLPICCYCKKIRDDNNYWHQLECYIMGHSEARFTHGICPHCMVHIVKPELDKLTHEDEAHGFASQTAHVVEPCPSSGHRHSIHNRRVNDTLADGGPAAHTADTVT